MTTTGRANPFSLRVIGLLLGVMLAGSAHAQMTAPRIAPADALQLAQAAGFRYVNGDLRNACGKPASPRFAFIDLNGDGQPEAVVIDKNAECYGAPGDWFSILARGPNGQWRALVREVGTLQWEQTRSRGWRDARIKAACDDIWHFNGTTYVPAQDCTPGRARTAAATPTPVPAPAPASPPAGGALSAADRTSLLRAAGFTLKGGQWHRCEEQSEVSIEPGDIRDINGDGQLDAIVTESTTACFGMTGQGFVLMTRTPAGQWRKLYDSPGIPEFLKTSANGWPDVEVGGPGFCAPVLRWNGQTYVFHHNHETAKGACARK